MTDEDKIERHEKSPIFNSSLIKRIKALSPYFFAWFALNPLMKISSIETDFPNLPVAFILQVAIPFVLFLITFYTLFMNDKNTMIKSKDEKIVNAFVHLLITKPSLFSQKDIDGLDNLINDTTDDIKVLSDIILEWLGKDSKLKHYLFITAGIISEIGVGFGAVFVFTPILGWSNAKSIPDYKPNKKVLKNAIQQSKNNSDNNQQNTDEKKS